MNTSKEAVFSYITAYLERVGFPPTIGEIGKGVGLSEPTVHYHLETLEIEGRIERKFNSPRGIRVL